MSDKRYQVFISSTYRDLAEERQHVMQTIMQMDGIPAGMELFPAADEEQFQFIKRVIDDCDYYLLILGGRYGSLAPDGISYTEKEYDYAVDKGIKVVAFVHGEPGMIPAGKCEQDPAVNAKLQVFREKVTSGRLVKEWKNAAELPGLVALSLSMTMKMFPAAGWVRGNAQGNPELLAEVVRLRRENDELKTKPQPPTEASAAIANLAQGTEAVPLEGSIWKAFANTGAWHRWKTVMTWDRIFWHFSPHLLQYQADSTVKTIISEAAATAAMATGQQAAVDDHIFQTLKIQFMALGLVKVEALPTTDGKVGVFWALTVVGRDKLLQIRSVRSTPSQPATATKGVGASAEPANKPLKRMVGRRRPPTA